MILLCMHACMHCWMCRIQAWWRGHKVRCWYKQYRDLVPPTHPQLRTKHFQKKLSSMTDKMVDMCESRHRQASHVMAQADDSIAKMREAFALFDLTVASSCVAWDEVRCKAGEHLSSDCSVCLMPLSASAGSAGHVIMDATDLSSSRVTGHSRPLSLLSCGHVLHETCIEALEHFTAPPGNSDSSRKSPMYLCPLCRTPYKKIRFQL